MASKVSKTASAAPDKPKPTGKRKGRGLSQKEQSERFIATARELGSDETGERFKEALDRILPR